MFFGVLGSAKGHTQTWRTPGRDGVVESALTPPSGGDVLFSPNLTLTLTPIGHNSARERLGDSKTSPLESPWPH